MAKYFKKQNGGVAAIDGVPVFLTQAQFEACCCDEDCDCSDFEGDSFQIEWPTNWTFTFSEDPTLPSGEYTISSGTYKQTDNILVGTTLGSDCIGVVEIPMDVSGVFGTLIYDDVSECWLLFIDTEWGTPIVGYELCGECSPYGEYTAVSQSVSGDTAPTTITISKEP